MSNVSNSPLGKNAQYITQYAPELLFPIPRKVKRDEINVPTHLPFHGFDTWNAYEVSWLNNKGKPVVAIIQFDISCFSTNIIESKSFKLYLNSFNNTQFDSVEAVHKVLMKDLATAVDGDIKVQIFKLSDFNEQKILSFTGDCLDEQDITCDTYTITPAFLSINTDQNITETLYSDLLKSNCLVTSQPDWGSIQITYTGSAIDKAGLLKYIVSFRDHNEFHEQCVERIFMDIMQYCKPKMLRVEARYTRRGGLDINPLRCSEVVGTAENIRMARQ